MNKLSKYATIGAVTLSMIAAYMPNVFADDGEDDSNRERTEQQIELEGEQLPQGEATSPAVGGGQEEGNGGEEGTGGNDPTEGGENNPNVPEVEPEPISGPSGEGAIPKNNPVTTDEHYHICGENACYLVKNAPNMTYYNGDVEKTIAALRSEIKPTIEEGYDYTVAFGQWEDVSSWPKFEDLGKVTALPGYIIEKIAATPDASDSEGNAVVGEIQIRHHVNEGISYRVKNDPIRVSYSRIKDTDNDGVYDAYLTEEEEAAARKQALERVLANVEYNLTEYPLTYLNISAMYGTPEDPFAADKLGNQHHLGVIAKASVNSDGNIYIDLKPNLDNMYIAPGDPMDEATRANAKADWIAHGRSAESFEETYDESATYAMVYAELYLHGETEKYEWTYNTAGGFILEFYYDGVIPVEYIGEGEIDEPDPNPDPDPDPTPIIIPITPNRVVDEPVIEDEVIPEGPAVTEEIAEEETALADTGTAEPTLFYSLGSLLMAIGAFVSGKKRKN